MDVDGEWRVEVNRKTDTLLRKAIICSKFPTDFLSRKGNLLTKSQRKETIFAECEPFFKGTQNKAALMP